MFEVYDLKANVCPGSLHVLFVGSSFPLSDLAYAFNLTPISFY